MRRSILRRVVAAGVVGLACSLLLVGASTTVVLHYREVAALDRALAAAAHARARPHRPGEWEVYHDPPEVHTWIVTEDDDVVKPGVYDRVLRKGEPLLKDQGDDRLLLVPAQVGDRGRVVIVAAMAERVTVGRSVGAFTLVWLAASAVVTAGAAAGLSGIVRLALRPLDDARGDVARVVGLGQGQRVSVDAPEEVRPLLEAVNALLDRLDQAFAGQVRFTADAAHELRTPVASLLMQLDVALRDDGGDARTALASVHEDVLRLRRLVEALTALSQVDAGAIEAHRELVRAREVVDAASGGQRLVLEAAGCVLTIDVIDDPELEVHQILLQLAVGNLLRNAATHAPGSPVTLTVRALGDLVAFEVRDAGPGVPDDVGEAVFDRFARGDGAQRADPSGLGLGLPLAREVARRHGGDCTLRRAPDGGTLATLTVRRPDAG